MSNKINATGYSNNSGFSYQNKVRQQLKDIENNTEGNFNVGLPPQPIPKSKISNEKLLKIPKNAIKPPSNYSTKTRQLSENRQARGMQIVSNNSRGQRKGSSDNFNLNPKKNVGNNYQVPTGGQEDINND